MLKDKIEKKINYIKGSKHKKKKTIKEIMTKFKINNKWEKNLQFWIEGGNSKEKSNSQTIKKTKNSIQNNDDQSWNISKLEDNSKILNDQYEFLGEERKRRKKKRD